MEGKLILKDGQKIAKKCLMSLLIGLVKFLIKLWTEKSVFWCTLQLDATMVEEKYFKL